ncbi:trace amine-associated receptor 7e-like [Dendronephthya gigantea]|uniref:trace amine-associated receptor 7e-like n=1 Tax=Dendronephthya gigantea TaxID=151771 RepID=UPI00106BA0C6|nr:trace amine-associated receptor 7e-like [Dendronephthya gigantea]
MNLDLDFQEQIALCYLIILVFIAIFTLLGNTLVLIVTWRERGLHQPNKYFIAFLAVADLLVGVLLIPLKLYQHNLDHESLSTMSLHLCRFLVWIDTFAFTISIYTLTFISFDRYLKISKPLQYKSRMTTSRSVKIIFLILIISTFIATYARHPSFRGIGHLVNGVGPCKLRTKQNPCSFWQNEMNLLNNILIIAFIGPLYISLCSVILQELFIFNNGVKHNVIQSFRTTDINKWTYVLAHEKQSLPYHVSLLVLIAIFTFFGNILVLIVTWKERSLHQPNKYFIAFLAGADLIVGFVVIPLKLYQLSLDAEQKNAMSVHLCRFSAWIDTFALTTSICTLNFISFDRYLKISKPLQYKSRMTTSRLVKIIFLIVFISSSIATYAAAPHPGNIALLENGVGPCILIHLDDRSKVFFTFLSIIVFFLPTIFMLIMYVFIFLVAHKRQKTFLNGELGQINNQNRRAALRQDIKVIKMLLVVVGVFICCWSPWILTILLSFYHPYIYGVSYRYYIAFVVIRALPLLNSMCNPVIYAWFDQTYREAFKRLFQRMMCRPDSRSQHMQ